MEYDIRPMNLTGEHDKIIDEIECGGIEISTAVARETGNIWNGGAASLRVLKANIMMHIAVTDMICNGVKICSSNFKM